MSSFTSVAGLLARLRERAPSWGSGVLVELEHLAAVLGRMPALIAVLVLVVLLALYAAKAAALVAIGVLLGVELLLRASAARGLAAASSPVGGGRS